VLGLRDRVVRSGRGHTRPHNTCPCCPPPPHHHPSTSTIRPLVS
jgi:hypothetical protein